MSEPWSGSYDGPDRVFSPQRSLKIPSKLCFCHFLYTLLLFPLFCESTHVFSVRLMQVRRGRNTL